MDTARLRESFARVAMHGDEATIVSDVEDTGPLTEFPQTLGRDHRKAGTIAAPYEPVGNSLLATLAHFSGPARTPELAADWVEANGLVAKATTERLSPLGVPATQVHVEDFGWSEPCP